MKSNLPYRPILRLPKSKFEKIIDGLGILLFAAANVYLIVSWGNIPSQVPAHFNGAGEVNRWGSKYEMLILPIIGLFLFVLMSLLEKAPHMHNYPSRINESNAEQFYLHSRKLANLIKNICLIMFAYIIVQMVRVSLGEIDSLSIWGVAILILVMFASIGVGLYKQTKIK